MKNKINARILSGMLGVSAAAFAMAPMLAGADDASTSVGLTGNVNGERTHVNIEASLSPGFLGRFYGTATRPFASGTRPEIMPRRFGSTTRPEWASGTRPQFGSTTRQENMQQRQQQKFQNIQGRGSGEIDARINIFDKLLERIGDMKKVSDSDKASLTAEIQAEIASLTALKAQIAGDTSSTTLSTDVKSITASYRVYALVLPKAQITATVDRINYIVNMMNSAGVKIKAYITAAQNAGHDVSAANAAYADYTAKVSDAQAQSQAAEAEVSALVPDNGDQTVAQSNEAALKDASSKIKTAQSDLKAAQADLNAIRKALKPSEEGSASESANVSATATASTTL